MATKYRVQ